MDNSKEVAFSIIIPHKNIPELLRRCINSIPLRDDIQIIIIDDNSDPTKVDFFNFPGLDRPNTEVYYTKEGKGAGYARNIGLSRARGKWLIFADSDDLFNDCFNLKMDEYLTSNFDIIYFQTNSIDSQSNMKIRSRGSVYNKWLRYSTDNNVILDKIRYNINPPWGKFFSHKMIKENSISFDETLTANDVMFSTKCGYLAKTIKIDLEYLYCSTIRKGSLDLTNKENYILPRFEVALKHYKYLKSVGKSKYHINIFESLNMIRKTGDKNIFKYAILKSFNEMSLKSLIFDFIDILKIKLKKNI